MGRSLVLFEPSFHRCEIGELIAVSCQLYASLSALLIEVATTPHNLG